MNPSSDALPLVRCRDCNSSLLQPLRADRIDDDSSCVTRACPDCGRQDTVIAADVAVQAWLHREADIAAQLTTAADAHAAEIARARRGSFADPR